MQDIEKTKDAEQSLCVECYSSTQSVICMDCKDTFCVICYQAQHRKGKRKNHKIKALTKEVADYFDSLKRKEKNRSAAGDSTMEGDIDLDLEDGLKLECVFVGDGTLEKGSPDWYLERAKYIPLRLSYEERKYLRLVENALSVTDYTSTVDGKVYKSEVKRLYAKTKEVSAVLAGILTAADYDKGQLLIEEKEYATYKGYFRRVLEIARRYKVMNPERMRADYGKLIYFLQDAVSPEVSEFLEFDIVMPIKTVYDTLERNDCLDLLRDKLISIATREVIDDKSKKRHQLQAEIRSKNQAIETLSRKYACERFDREDIRICLYSIGDNSSYLTTNRDPVDTMINYLETNFHPDTVKEGFSLAISGGEDGARLSHSHNKQYHYVKQSLELWSDIAFDMFKLWKMSEDDLLDPSNPYKLQNTGQGIHRVQNAPMISRAMRELIHNMQARIGHWVGSSVVHLGDHNVPNALVFIDKYTQVSRILLPIVKVLLDIDGMMDSPAISKYINEKWESKKLLKLNILNDFFRHAFDGSGADNFYDAGSCIDGRLTSAWNWCSKLDSKPFFPIFKLSGFTSFDGEFQS